MTQQNQQSQIYGQIQSVDQQSGTITLQIDQQTMQKSDQWSSAFQQGQQVSLQQSSSSSSGSSSS